MQRLATLPQWKDRLTPTPHKTTRIASWSASSPIRRKRTSPTARKKAHTFQPSSSNNDTRDSSLDVSIGDDGMLNISGPENDSEDENDDVGDDGGDGDNGDTSAATLTVDQSAGDLTAEKEDADESDDESEGKGDDGEGKDDDDDDGEGKGDGEGVQANEAEAEAAKPAVENDAKKEEKDDDDGDDFEDDDDEDDRPAPTKPTPAKDEDDGDGFDDDDDEDDKPAYFPHFLGKSYEKPHEVQGVHKA